MNSLREPSFPQPAGEHGCSLLLAPFPPVSSTEQAQKSPECSSLATPGTKPSLDLGWFGGFFAGFGVFWVVFHYSPSPKCLVIPGSLCPPSSAALLGPAATPRTGPWVLGDTEAGGCGLFAAAWVHPSPYILSSVFLCSMHLVLVLTAGEEGDEWPFSPDAQRSPF